jgi:hypothetical protein
VGAEEMRHPAPFPFPLALPALALLKRTRSNDHGFVWDVMGYHGQNWASKGFTKLGQEKSEETL